MTRPEEDEDDGMPTKSEIRVREEKAIRESNKELEQPKRTPLRKSEDEKPVGKDRDSKDS